MLDVRRRDFITLLGQRNIPAISLFPEFAREGGLLAYGPDIQDVYRQAGALARKVLNGAKPAELPAERPTRSSSSPT